MSVINSIKKARTEKHILQKDLADAVQCDAKVEDDPS